MHVVDTDVCIDALRGDPEAVKALGALEQLGPLAITSITAHELWQGAYRTSDVEATTVALERFMAAFDLLAYDEGAAHEGGRIAAELLAEGRPIGDLDTMIAATALAHGAKLVTRNVRHFGSVPGLPVVGV